MSELLIRSVFDELQEKDLKKRTRARIYLFLNFLTEKIRLFSPVYNVNKKFMLNSFKRDDNLKILILNEPC